MPHIHQMEWDWEELRWKVILSDGFHTWQGKSALVSFALAIAFTRYFLDLGR